MTKRGGTVLTLAAVSCARGTWNQWHALSPQLAHAACEIVDTLRRDDNASRLAGTLAAALDNTPTAPMPDYLATVGDETLVPLGKAIPVSWPPPEGTPLANREAGLAILAIACCRNTDVVHKLASHLSEDNETALIRMARLAAATVRPGAPRAIHSW